MVGNAESATVPIPAAVDVLHLKNGISSDTINSTIAKAAIENLYTAQERRRLRDNPSKPNSTPFQHFREDRTINATCT